MSAPATISPDPVTSFMGKLPPDEYLWRSRIHGCREVATSRAATTDCPEARQLCWMVIETASEAVFARLPTTTLEEVAQFLKHLLVCSDQAERLLGAG